MFMGLEMSSEWLFRMLEALSALGVSGVSARLLNLKSLIHSGLENALVLNEASEETFTPGVL